MDIRMAAGPATPEEVAAVDGFLGPPATGWEGGAREANGSHAAYGGRHDRARRHLLLPVLHAVQDRVGWVSPGALDYACRRLTVPPAEGYGVASFYALFNLEERPPRVVHVCDDLACRCAGADALCGELERRVGPEGAARDGAAWLRSPCLGLCEGAPAALAQRFGPEGEHAEARLAPAALGEVEEALGGSLPGSEPGVLLAQDPEELRLLRRVGRVAPESLDSYRAAGGYQALRRAVELGPEAVLREVLDARLLGRGGAAFPTGRKWEAVAHSAVRPRYLVANADESEPGTFKDRVLMEEDPFSLIEAMTIAAYAAGAEHGYVYVRGEYPLARRRLQGAIEAARTRGLLGEDVLGHGFRFDVEIWRGAGAYISGEETAMFNSLEGKRGEPRNKPPFPTQAGLFGKPTVVNNVETLINVLDIVLEGGEAFARIGTEGSTGTRLFCVSGHVERPGLFELPFGATLGRVLELAGGVRAGHRLQAILLGGAAGSFVTSEHRYLPLTFEDTRKAGTTLGSGVVMVFDETADLRDVVLRIARFFRDESCGQCVPCRVGTVRQEELLHRVLRGGSPADGELALQRDLSQVMRDASICGLGQTASAAVDSALRLGLLGLNAEGDS
ncbi:MAG: NAD(P)H-dependent oxidoreductase subunit E [bacterium]|jgi:NADH-quinone oxidoreductase subunit F|nr:NAD(P)H-dependent oxidoreductase subunit E [bacterium]